MTLPTTTREPAPVRRPWFLSWPVLIALFWLPGIVWSLASPLFSVPDEASHVVRAVGIWHGQIVEEDAIVQVPAIWGQAAPQLECYAFKPTTTADCAPPFAGSDETADVFTTANRYPPLFYVAVGWAGRVSAGPLGVHLMRITGALLCAAMLAASVRALSRIIDPRLALAGTLVAATPMVLFLAGSVNSNGLEACAAIAVWSTLLTVLRWGDRHNGPIPRPLIVQLALVASVLALVRPVSPAFLGVIGILTCASVPFGWVLRTLRDRAVLVAGAVAVVVSLAAGAYVTSTGAMAATIGFPIGDRNPLLAIVGQTSDYVEGMVGIFGWLDTRPPLFTLLVWLGVVFGLLALALGLGSLRSVLSLGATVAATLVLPIAAQLPSAATSGLPWQGRYTLPIAVGIPLLAVVVIDGQRALAAQLVARVSAGVVLLTGAASVAAVFWALRRYVTGITGSLDISGGSWQPPGGSVLLVAAMVLFVAATLALVVLAGRKASPPDVARPLAGSGPGSADGDDDRDDDRDDRTAPAAVVAGLTGA